MVYHWRYSLYIADEFENDFRDSLKLLLASNEPPVKFLEDLDSQNLGNSINELRSAKSPRDHPPKIIPIFLTSEHSLPIILNAINAIDPNIEKQFEKMVPFYLLIIWINEGENTIREVHQELARNGGEEKIVSFLISSTKGDGNKVDKETIRSQIKILLENIIYGQMLNVENFFRWLQSFKAKRYTFISVAFGIDLYKIGRIFQLVYKNKYLEERLVREIQEESLKEMVEDKKTQLENLLNEWKLYAKITIDLTPFKRKIKYPSFWTGSSAKQKAYTTFEKAISENLKRFLGAIRKSAKETRKNLEEKALERVDSMKDYIRQQRRDSRSLNEYIEKMKALKKEFVNLKEKYKPDWKIFSSPGDFKVEKYLGPKWVPAVIGIISGGGFFYGGMLKNLAILREVGTGIGFLSLLYLLFSYLKFLTTKRKNLSKYEKYLRKAKSVFEKNIPYLAINVWLHYIETYISYIERELRYYEPIMEYWKRFYEQNKKKLKNLSSNTEVREKIWNFIKEDHFPHWESMKDKEKFEKEILKAIKKEFEDFRKDTDWTENIWQPFMETISPLIESVNIEEWTWNDNLPQEFRQSVERIFRGTTLFFPIRDRSNKVNIYLVYDRSLVPINFLELAKESPDIFMIGEVVESRPDYRSFIAIYHISEGG